MTSIQKVIKYCATAFAVFLTVSIIGGILGAAGLFGGVFGEGGVSEETETYTVSQNTTGLKVDINAADLTITKGESFFVESNLEKLTVEEKDGTLTVAEKSKIGWGQNYNNAVLILHIPGDFVFEKAEITTGAGRLTVDSLSADDLHLELGAGEVKIGELNASRRAEIDGGAGAVTISGGTLYDLDLDMGVGKLDLTAAILGNSELDYGVGEADLTLIGSKDDYRLTFDKGLGRAVVDGQEMSDGSTYGSGENRIDIDGGVGAVDVDFREK